MVASLVPKILWGDLGESDFGGNMGVSRSAVLLCEGVQLAVESSVCDLCVRVYDDMGVVLSPLGETGLSAYAFDEVGLRPASGELFFSRVSRHDDDDFTGDPEPCTGMCIRNGVDDNWESASTTIPVELGDSGEVKMGAGIVCRLRYFGVTYASFAEGGDAEVGVSGRS